MTLLRLQRLLQHLNGAVLHAALTKRHGRLAVGAAVRRHQGAGRRVLEGVLADQVQAAAEESRRRGRAARAGPSGVHVHRHRESTDLVGVIGDEAWETLLAWHDEKLYDFIGGLLVLAIAGEHYVIYKLYRRGCSRERRMRRGSAGRRPMRSIDR